MADELYGVGADKFKRLKDMGDGSWAEVVAPACVGGVVTTHMDGTPLKIASGASISGAVDFGVSPRLCRIVAPDAWTAAVLTFQVSYDGVTFKDLYDESGAEVSYTIVAGKSMRVPLSDWIGVRYLKIRSGTSSAPVNQGGDRAFILVTA